MSNVILQGICQSKSQTQHKSTVDNPPPPAGVDGNPEICRRQGQLDNGRTTARRRVDELRHFSGWIL